MFIPEKMVEEMFKELEELNTIREELISTCREIRINSTKAIAYMHQNKIEEANQLLSSAESKIKNIRNFRNYSFYQAITHEAMQEFVEAKTFMCYLNDETLPKFRELCETPAILSGLADAAGELRRFALNKMIYGDLSEAEKCIKIMEEIYNVLALFHFPEKLVPGLRHKIDVLRNLIDKTKSDWIAARIIKEEIK